MNKEQAWNKFCNLQYQYYYWDGPTGKDIGIYGTEKRKKNVKQLINLLKQSKSVWINKLNRTRENEAKARLANILGFCFEGTAEDFIKIWDFVMDDNKKISDFDSLYKTLYQSKTWEERNKRK